MFLRLIIILFSILNIFGMSISETSTEYPKERSLFDKLDKKKREYPQCFKDEIDFTNEYTKPKLNVSFSENLSPEDYAKFKLYFIERIIDESVNNLIEKNNNNLGSQEISKIEETIKMATRLEAINWIRINFRKYIGLSETDVNHEISKYIYQTAFHYIHSPDKRHLNNLKFVLDNFKPNINLIKNSNNIGLQIQNQTLLFNILHRMSKHIDFENLKRPLNELIDIITLLINYGANANIQTNHTILKALNSYSIGSNYYEKHTGVQESFFATNSREIVERFLEISKKISQNNMINYEDSPTVKDLQKIKLILSRQ